MKKWYFGILLTMVILTGCYSFNTITLPDAEQAQSSTIKKLASEIVKETKKATKPLKEKTHPQTNTLNDGDVACPVYVMPAFSNTPELPFEEIIAADKNDAQTLDRIQRDHINELRHYIARFKASMLASHNDYLKKCQVIKDKKLSETK